MKLIVSTLAFLITWPLGAQGAEVSTQTPGFEGTLQWALTSVNRDQLANFGIDPTSDETILGSPVDELLAKAPPKKTTLQIKGNRVREVGSYKKGSYMLVDTTSSDVWIVMPSTKQYIAWTKEEREELDARLAAAKKAKAEAQQAEPAKPEEKQEEAKPDDALEKLDQTAEFLGMKATAYRTESDGKKAIGWVTSDHPTLKKLMYDIQDTQRRARPSQAPSARDPKATLAAAGLPLRIHTINKRRYTVERLTSIKPGKLDDSLFELPAGYTKTSPIEMLRKVMRASGDAIGKSLGKAMKQKQ